MATRDLNVKIDGDPKGFQAAAAKAGMAAKRLEQSLARMEAKQRSGQKSAMLMRGELVTLGAAATTISPAFIAAGAGAVAFGALAAPAILKVVKAQEDLVKNWDSLTDAEKVSAVGLRNVVSQYKALARSLEPETLGLFNQALGVTSRQMPRLAPIARSVSAELGHFVDNLERALDSEEGREFERFVQEMSGPATRQVGETLGSAAGAATNLLEALGPVAGVGLKTVGMLLDLVGAVSDAAPGLTQMAVLTMALRGPIGGLGDMLGTAGGRLTTFGDQATGVRGKAAGLGKALTGMGAILSGPWGLAVTGAVALLGVFAANSADAAAEVAEFEGAIRQDAGALGQATRALTAHKLEEEGLLDLAQKSGVSMSTYTDAILGNKDAHADVTSVIDAQISSLKRQNDENKISFEGYRAGVEPLIELKDALRGKNKTINEATASYKRLQDAQQASIQPTNAIKLAWEVAGNEAEDLKVRTDALTSAFDAYFNPALALLGMTNRWKDVLAESNRVLKDGNATSADRSKALESQLGVLRDWATAEMRSTGSIQDSSAAMIEQLPTLARLTGGNNEGRASLTRLVEAMQGSITWSGNAFVAVDKFGNRVERLPSGKIVVVKASTANAMAAFGAVITRMERLSNGVTVPVRYVQYGPGLSRVGGSGVLSRQSYMNADGSITYFANGSERHVAQIAPAGAWRVWAEDETEGEAYIPLARSKRGRSEEILSVVAEKFGGRYVKMAAGGVLSLAGGGTVDAPLGDYVERFMGGKAMSRTDYAKVVRSRADAVDQLRRAERKLAADRRAHKSAKTIADDEARVAKERRDLLTATEKLTAATLRYKRSKLAPAARLGAALDLGIKNSGAFIKNLEKIAARGFPELARQLLAMGGPEAEKYAASAAKLSATKLKSLAGKVTRAAKNQAKLEALPGILAVKAARKAGAKNIPQVMRMTGLSEDDLRETYAAMGYARGGIARYARGGVRPGPGIATRPTVLFGEGRAPEGFVPYDPAHRSRAVGLVSQMARDFGMTRPGGAGSCHCSVTIDVTGADSHMLRMIRSMVRVKGRGNVQVAFGKAG